MCRVIKYLYPRLQLYTLPVSSIPVHTMPIALRSNRGRSSEKLASINTTPVFDSQDERADRRHLAEIEEEDDSCSSSSSIGNNSDGAAESSEDEADAESSAKGPLDCLEVLEKDLPMRKGISSFYTGKSKSFTSLSDAVTVSSANDLAKPEDPYAKKRKNLLAHRINAPGVSTGSLERGHSTDFSFMHGGSPSRCRPPLPLHPPHKKTPNISRQPSPPKQCVPPPCRSFSLSDLRCVAAGTPNHNK